MLGVHLALYLCQMKCYPDKKPYPVIIPSNNFAKMFDLFIICAEAVNMNKYTLLTWGEKVKGVRDFTCVCRLKGQS